MLSFEVKGGVVAADTLLQAVKLPLTAVRCDALTRLMPLPSCALYYLTALLPCSHLASLLGLSCVSLSKESSKRAVHEVIAVCYVTDCCGRPSQLGRGGVTDHTAIDVNARWHDRGRAAGSRHLRQPCPSLGGHRGRGRPDCGFAAGANGSGSSDWRCRGSGRQGVQWTVFWACVSDSVQTRKVFLHTRTIRPIHRVIPLAECFQCFQFPKCALCRCMISWIQCTL